MEARLRRACVIGLRIYRRVSSPVRTMCRFKIVARSGGRAACFNVRKIWEARKPVRIVSVTLDGDWCCVLTRIDARISLCEGRSHILTYQAGGSSGRYRVNETRAHHIVGNRRQGCSRCKFSARINRWVRLLPWWF